MKIIKPSVELINPPDYSTMLNTTELAIRNCYNSYDKMTAYSAEGMIEKCIKRHHDSPLEFCDITVKIVGSRALMSQITRHRLASFCIRSLRYTKLDELGVIEPEGLDSESYDCWRASCLTAEAAYRVMLNDQKMKPEIARSVLPQCTATTIYMKANIREWRHILDLRANPAAQGEIRELMKSLLQVLRDIYPVFFKDVYEKYAVD